jgi:hypothetical protein
VGDGLLWRQGKQFAIQEHIGRPFLAAAQDESVRPMPSVAAA